MSATVTMSLEDYNNLQKELANLRATHEELYIKKSNNEMEWNYYKVMTKEEFIEELEEVNENLRREYRELDINRRTLELEIHSLKNKIQDIMERGFWDRVKNKKIS